MIEWMTIRGLHRDNLPPYPVSPYPAHSMHVTFRSC